MKKFMVKLVLVLTLFIVPSSNVLAFTGIDASFRADKTEIRKNDKITIFLKLDKFTGIKRGINAYKATLEYDEKIFERVNASDFVCLNNWEQLQYNPVTKEFIAIKRAGTTVEEDVVKVTLKVKSNIKAGVTTIKVKDMVTSNGTADMNIKAKTIKLDVIKVNSVNNNNNNVGNTNQDNNTNIDNNTTPNDPIVDDNDSENNDNTNIGTEEEDKWNDKNHNRYDKKRTFFLFKILLILLIIILIIYIILKQNKKFSDKDSYYTFIIISLLSLVFFETVSAFSYDFNNKGELNGDGQVNYLDANLLELHLINLKYLPKDKHNNADISSDGKLTVMDLSLLIQKIENTLDYTVHLSTSEQQNYYPKKNSTVTLKFIAEVSYGASVDKVLINNQEYIVKKTNLPNEYEVEVPTENVSGVKEYKINKVILNNNKIINANHIIKVDVLKDSPIIENYRADENIDSSTFNISFDVKDLDKSLTNAVIEIVDDKEETIYGKELVIGTNKIVVNVEEKKQYIARIYLYYDLSSGMIDDATDNTGVVNFSKKFQLIKDYEIKVSDINTYKGDVESFKFEIIDDIKIGFSSTNASIYTPEQAKINGKYYNITKENGKYYVIYPKITDVGKKTLKIESIVLSNGKELTIDKNNTIQVSILKEKPSISNVEVTEDSEKGTMNVKAYFKDIHHSLSNIKIAVYKSNDELIDEKSFPFNELSQTTSIESIFNVPVDIRYKIKVFASYELDETTIIGNGLLYEKTVEAIPKASIKNVNKPSVIEKNTKFNISYVIDTNQVSDVTKIRVNNEEFNVKKTADNTYQIELTSPAEAGNYELNLTRIYVQEGNKEIKLNHKAVVEVLKDAPTISNYKVKDNYTEKSVTLSFDINDKEQAFASAKIRLINSETSELVKEINNLSVGTNKIDINVIENVRYTLEILVSYDRDTKKTVVVKDSVLLTKPIQLIKDYQLQLTNLKTYNSKNTETIYFTKNENIKVSFNSTNISMFTPTEVIINGNNYDLGEENGSYYTEIPSYDQSGVKNISIEKIILSNGKELELENKSIQIEILKDNPTVNKFSYQENDDNTVNVIFELIDNENTITSNKIIIKDESNKIVKETTINNGKNTVKFIKNGSEEYYVQIIVNYDLDNDHANQKNEYSNAIILNETINVGMRQYEMKDIENITLYKETSTGVNEVLSVKESDLTDLSKYLVRVDMKNIPSFYTTIDEYKIENNQIKFVLAYNNIVQYVGNKKQHKLEVVYGTLENNVASNRSLDDIIKAIIANPSGEFNLDKDYDASGYGGNSLIDSSVIFKGKLNGNGHTIKGLTKPLFYTLNGATIENLILSDAKVNGNGVLASTMSSTTLTNVHIKNSTVIGPNANGTGSLVGYVDQNSLIEKCSATNVVVGNQKRTGGFIGRIYNSTIRNSYVQGKVSSSSDGSGGFIGESPSGVVVENVYANVIVTFGNGTLAGISGYSKNIILKNTLSLATNTNDGNGYRVVGSGINNASSNNYELETSNMKTQASHNAISTVSPEDLKKKSFYTENLGWSEEIWDFSKVASGQYPTLKEKDPNYSENIIEKPSNQNVYIPEYKRIKGLNNYDVNREIAYHNMHKLMPFYDAKFYLVDGNKLEVNHLLNTKIIKEIFAYDAAGKLVLSLNQNDQNRIKTIRLLFTDDETITYNVTYKEDDKQIITYNIEELGINYNFNKYIVNKNSKVYEYIVNKISTYDYVNDLAVLTDETEGRNYIDNFARVKTNAENIAMNLLANTKEFNLTSNSPILEKKLIQDLKANNTLEKLIYAYNYFDRFYNIEIGGINMRDIIFFDGKVFSDKLNVTSMTKNLLLPETKRETTQAYNYYNNYIRTLTGKDIYSFFDYFITNLTNEKYKKDSASWIIDNYQGVIYEEGAPRYSNIRYRVWDHLKNRQHIILYILSYPEDDLYVLGIPTTILVGNLRLYFSNIDSVDYETKLRALKNFASLAVPFYDTIAGVVEELPGNGFKNVSNMSQISYDSTIGKDWSNDPNAAPAFKYFYEAMGHWITKPAGSAAFANGTDMNWVAHHALSDFVVFSHEGIHNQDGKIFLDGRGRRSGAGAEHFTDNFLTQPYPNAINSVYGVVPNYTYTRPIDSTMTTNLTKERINTLANIESYYKGMYDTFAFLDYIEAMAFLRLTPEEQCKIAQVIDNQAYSWKTAEDFRKMNLKTIEDIWDNHLVIVRGNKAYTTGSFWYIVENTASTGAANKAFFVLNAYQLLADFGYNGYVAYASGQYNGKSDAEILKIIANDENITWKSYQLNRYKKVEDKIKTFTKIDVQKAINTTLEAMQLDVAYNKPIDLNSNASTYREALYGYLKRVTDDFRSSIYDETPNVVHVTSAEDLIAKVKNNPEVNIILDNDLDFSNIPVKISDDSMLNTFVGTLDGNNHKITGLKRALFNKLVFTYVKNLTIENVDVTCFTNNAGSLSRTIDFSIIENVNLKNVNVTGTVTIGGLAGTINRTTVSNVKYEVNVSSSINSGTIGGLFGVATYSSLENVHGVNSTITGNGNIGGIIGNANYIYKIDKSSFNGSVVNSGNNAGGLVGYFQNSTIKNSYSLGSVNGNSNVGGIAGYISSSIINNTFSNASVRGRNLASTGGLFGAIVNASNGRTVSNISNNISLGKVNNGYKLYGNATKEVVEGNFNNNYELIEAVGTASSEKSGISFTNRITAINRSTVNSNFYTNNLRFNANIWNFVNVNGGGLPKLKNSDPNNITNTMAKREIASLRDFLNLNNSPDDDYILTADIDFNGYSNTNTSVIMSTFTGTIEGNNHTIKNLNNQSLFANFKGNIQNLKIINFTNNRESENFVAAFASQTNGATLRNIKFENITLNGVNNIGVIAGQDGKETATSTFDRISVKNANVKGSGVYVSTFIGRKFGGSIKNVYVQGQLDVTTTENGGIVGASQQSVVIENVISNVSIIKNSNTYNGASRNYYNGGIVGNIYDETMIKNSIAIGNMSGTTGFMPYKFTGAEPSNVNTKLNNCFEYNDATGLSRVTDSSNGKLNNATNSDIHSKAFYKDRMHFDESIWNLDTISANGYPELR